MITPRSIPMDKAAVARHQRSETIKRCIYYGLALIFAVVLLVLTITQRDLLGDEATGIAYFNQITGLFLYLVCFVSQCFIIDFFFRRRQRHYDYVDDPISFEHVLSTRPELLLYRRHVAQLDRRLTCIELTDLMTWLSLVNDIDAQQLSENLESDLVHRVSHLF